MVAHPVRKADETTVLLAVSLRKSRRDIAENSLPIAELLWVSFDRDYYRDGDIVNFDIGSSIPHLLALRFHDLLSVRRPLTFGSKVGNDGGRVVSN